MGRRITTMDHDEIKNWITERNGHPVIREEQKSEGPLTSLSVEFNDKEIGGKVKEDLDWKGFFDVFEKKMLAFQYDEEEEDSKSKDFKFVGRNL